jgi:hypothetical protein
MWQVAMLHSLPVVYTHVCEYIQRMWCRQVADRSIVTINLKNTFPASLYNDHLNNGQWVRRRLFWYSGRRTSSVIFNRRHACIAKQTCVRVVMTYFGYDNISASLVIARNPKAATTRKHITSTYGYFRLPVKNLL